MTSETPTPPHLARRHSSRTLILVAGVSALIGFAFGGAGSVWLAFRMMPWTEPAALRSRPRRNLPPTSPSPLPRPPTPAPVDDKPSIPLAMLPPEARPVTREKPTSLTSLDPVALAVLSPPGVFEETHFRFATIPAPATELAQAAHALVDQVNVVPEYGSAHPVMHLNLQALKTNSDRLLAAQADAVEGAREQLGRSIVEIRQTATAIAGRTYRETPESLEFTRQINALAEVLEKYQPTKER